MSTQVDNCFIEDLDFNPEPHCVTSVHSVFRPLDGRRSLLDV
jgi:hypothetical protein